MKLQMYNIIIENNVTGQTNVEKTYLDDKHWFLCNPEHILLCFVHCGIEGKINSNLI